MPSLSYYVALLAGGGRTGERQGFCIEGGYLDWGSYCDEGCGAVEVGFAGDGIYYDTFFIAC